MKIDKIHYGPYEALRIYVLDKFLDYIPQRAQIIRYASIQKPDILWGNPEASFQPGQAIRSGIPLCWPWFSHLAANPHSVQAMHDSTISAPSHGFARCVEWNNHTLETYQESVIITNCLQTSPLLTPQWPHETELKITIRFDENLSIQLQIKNKSDHDLAITQALHNYFFVSDIRKIHIHGLKGLKYSEQDSHGQPQIKTQTDDPHLTGPTDRIYSHTPAELSIDDPNWSRRIVIQAPLSHSAVLWTPWQQEAQTMSQFPKALWNQVVCLEIGTLLDQMQIVRAQSTETLDMTLKVIETT